jgi:ABC-type uncharacterized transport system involved in gliding motility auxiliary subunit
VRVLSTFEKTIPDDVDLLILIHPKELSPATQFAIDQYALRRGRVLALLDPYSDIEAPPRDPIMPTMTLPKTGSDLGPLLAAWGVQMADGVVGDREAARLVSFRDDAPPQEYLLWLDLQPPRFNADDPVTGRLSQMYMNTVGALAKKADAGIEFTPLISSSTQAMLFGTDNLDKPDPEALLREFEPTGQAYTLAARVQGPLGTAFPDGAPEGAETPQTVLTESAMPANLILVADADFIYDRFWARAVRRQRCTVHQHGGQPDRQRRPHRRALAGHLCPAVHRGAGHEPRRAGGIPGGRTAPAGAVAADRAEAGAAAGQPCR